ncbi:efflux transporter outer membrane subunit [Flavobacterium sp. LPB0248]|uniref:efflux transporter outer membrane subunit n=1 Tax=Flavobacterium sp. LPB0248 TaxID=2614441 RepID=UPI0015A6AD1D|nr:efflux transporter outer membrane subunit [Flavobacterium sp. LPB0248]QLC64758.1 efflux transporter outer membrane subunit [Flavobacterium sp. LPB0248]
MRVYQTNYSRIYTGKILLIGFISALMLYGCKVKTPPENKELQKEAFTNLILPSNWKAAKTDATDATAVQNNWISFFNDPALDSIVAEAIRYNVDLRVSSARIEQASGYVKASQAALRPAVSLLGRSSTKMGDDLNSGLSGALFSASWELDIWGKLRNARNANQAIFVATQKDYKFAKLSISAAVARNWYLASETYLESQLADQMVDASQEILALAKKRHEIGIGTEIDIEVASSNLSVMKDGQQQLKLAYSNQLRALEILLGRYPSAEIQVNKELIEIKGTIPAGIPLQILENRPDIVAAEKRFAAAFHRVEESRLARLPNLKLTGSFGAITSEVIQLKPDFSNPIGGVGGTVAQPLYLGGAINANIVIRTAEQKVAVAEYARSVLNAIADVENALDAVQTVEEREKLLRLSVTSNQKSFQLEQKLFEVGKTDLRSVSKQQIDLFASQISLLRIQSEKITQRINLFLALGGNSN